MMKLNRVKGVSQVVDELSRANGENVTAAPLLQCPATSSMEVTYAGFN